MLKYKTKDLYFVKQEGFTCASLTAACCADALKITMVTKYVSSSTEVKDFGKPERRRFLFIMTLDCFYFEM